MPLCRVVLCCQLLVAAAFATELVRVDPSLVAPGKGQVTVGDHALPLATAGAWFGSGAVSAELGVQDLREGVVSFWLLPVAFPVTGQVRITDRNQAVGSEMRWPDAVDVVWGGDWKRKRQSLRVAVTREGKVLANHLSWHKQSQWLGGVASSDPVLQTGVWTHIAYGFGPAGQRLWINGELVAANAADTQPVSWPYQLRFGELAGAFADAKLTSVVAASPAPPELAWGNPLATELFAVTRDGSAWQERLARLGAMPYEQARLNIIRRSAPLLLYQALLEQHQPAPEGVDLYALLHDEANWLLAAAPAWQERLAALEAGQANGLSVPAIQPDMRTVLVHDGAFWQDGRPVYFVGLQDARFDLMEGLGLSFSGHTFGPDWTMPKEGVFRESGKDQASRAARAAGHGMLWDILYSGHNFPGWAKKKYPELQVGIGFMGHDPLSEHGWAIHEATLRKTLPDLADAPNLLGLDLANEPAFNGKTVDAEANWRRWLARRHGTIDTLNRNWETHYANWDEIPVPGFVNPAWSSPWGQSFPTDPAGLRVYGDWSRFNLERVNDWYAKVHALARSYLPHTYTYTKMIQSTTSNARMGIDVVANVRTTDLSGSDSWWVFQGLAEGGATAADQMSGTSGDKGSGEAVNWSSLMLYDLLTSARPDAPAANAEFHLFGDSYKPMSSEWKDPPPGHWDRPIPASHFHAGVWQQAVHGQAMANIWTHWPRNNATERPQALAAISQAAMDLNRLSREVHALERVERPVGILWGLSPILWDTGGKWHPQVDASWRTLWRALTLNGLRPRFVFERDLAAGKVPDVKLLVIADFAHIDPQALAGLRAARAGGVRIWTVGDVLRFDPYGHPHAADLLPEADRTIAPDAFAQDPCTVLRDALAAANLLPAVQVFAGDTPAWQIHARAVPWEGGVLLNLCNHSRHAVTAQVRGTSAETALDLISGTTTNLREVVLRPEEIRLLRIP